jgi:hypothetical protein
MDSPRSYGLRRDTGRTLVSSLSADFRPRTNDSAGRRSVINRDVRHYVLLQLSHLPASADPTLWLRINKLNWSTLRMSGIFNLLGYIGNLPKAIRSPLADVMI